MLSMGVVPLARGVVGVALLLSAFVGCGVGTLFALRSKINPLLVMLYRMALFLFYLLVRSLLDSGLLTSPRTVWCSGCVLPARLAFLVMTPLQVVLASPTPTLPVTRCRCRLLISRRVTPARPLFESPRNIITLLTWPSSLGWNRCPSLFTVWFPTLSEARFRLLAALKLMSVLRVTLWVFMPDATTTIAPWKLIAPFRSLARWFLLNIRSRTPKTLGRVPLTLLNSMIEHGRW